MATQGPPCARCGWTLRWHQPQFAWVCDSCRVVYPSAPAPGPRAVAPRRGRHRAAIGVEAADPNAPFAGSHLPAAARGRGAFRPRPMTLVAIGAAAVAAVVVVVVFVVNSDDGSANAPKSRDELIKRSVEALAAHDTKALMRLVDYDTLRERMLDCDGSAESEERGRKNAEEMRSSMQAEVDRTFSYDLELDEIEPDKSDDPFGVPKATPLKRGDNAGDGCRFKVDADFHDLKFTIKVKSRGTTHRQEASMMAIELGGQWHLLGPPRIAGEIGVVECDTAVKHAIELTKPDLLKMPRMTDTKIDSLELTLTERCRMDSWSQDIRSCIGDARYATSLEGCLAKLSPTELTSVTDAISRAADEYP
jgi:hypothetical protein